MFQRTQKTVLAPQAQFINEVVDIPVVQQRTRPHRLPWSKVCTTMSSTLVRYIDKVVVVALRRHAKLVLVYREMTKRVAMSNEESAHEHLVG